MLESHSYKHCCDLSALPLRKTTKLLNITAHLLNKPSFLTKINFIGSKGGRAETQCPCQTVRCYSCHHCAHRESFTLWGVWFTD